MERHIFLQGITYKALKNISSGTFKFYAGEALVFLRDGYSPYDESFIYEFRSDEGVTKSWIMPEDASENYWEQYFIQV
jgi:hypothetical protein